MKFEEEAIVCPLGRADGVRGERGGGRDEIEELSTRRENQTAKTQQNAKKAYVPLLLYHYYYY